MMRPTVTALLAALAQFCSAEPALRGQDLDQQDPGPLPVVRGGDRPVAVPSASASPQEAPDGQRQVALLARGGQVLDQSPRARELQQECGGIVPSALDGEFCGYCVDSNDKFYEGILFYDVPSHEECFALCPINGKFVGYDYTPVGNLCICRYEDGTVTRHSCPDSYNGSCLTSIGWIGEGPVAGGDGDLNVACRARRFCGDIQLPVDSFEFCGRCVNSNGDIYEGILFYDVPGHEECFALCPVSDKYVGYEYLPSDPTRRIENFCICRYEDGTVVRDYCPEGICRNADGTVSGISCPAGYNESNCRVSRSWLGEGPVAGGDGDSHVACRTRFADEAALAWLEAQTCTGNTGTSMMTYHEFLNWSQNLAAEILEGNFDHGHVANPGKLVDIARDNRIHARNMAACAVHVCDPDNHDPQAAGFFCGKCRDSGNRQYDYISFLHVGTHEECLWKCPLSHAFNEYAFANFLMGYEFAPNMGYHEGVGLCVCRYSRGFVVTSATAGENGCPADAGSFGGGNPCYANPSHEERGRAQVARGSAASGNNDSRFACYAPAVNTNFQRRLELYQLRTLSQHGYVAQPELHDSVYDEVPAGVNMRGNDFDPCPACGLRP